MKYVRPRRGMNPGLESLRCRMGMSQRKMSAWMGLHESEVARLIMAPGMVMTATTVERVFKKIEAENGFRLACEVALALGRLPAHVQCLLEDNHQTDLENAMGLEELSHSIIEMSTGEQKELARVIRVAIDRVKEERRCPEEAIRNIDTTPTMSRKDRPKPSWKKLLSPRSPRKNPKAPAARPEKS